MGAPPPYGACITVECRYGKGVSTRQAFGWSGGLATCRPKPGAGQADGQKMWTDWTKHRMCRVPTTRYKPSWLFGCCGDERWLVIDGSISPHAGATAAFPAESFGSHVFVCCVVGPRVFLSGPGPCVRARACGVYPRFRVFRPAPSYWGTTFRLVLEPLSVYT